MKRVLFVLVCIVPFLFGPSACKPQNPVTPPQSTCPPVGSYVAFPGATNGTTATTFTASSVSAQTCFLAQGSLPAANGVIPLNGNPTNIVGPTVGGTTGKVQLSVTPTPTAGQTSAGEQWTFFSAPATTALAPANGTVGPPTTSQVVKPALPGTEAPSGTLAVTILPSKLTIQPIAYVKHGCPVGYVPIDAIEPFFYSYNDSPPVTKCVLESQNGELVITAELEK